MSRLFKRALFLSLALHLTAFLFFRLREARLPSATVPLQIEFKEVPRGHSMSNGKIKSQADTRERGSKFKNILKNMGAGTLNLALNGGAKGAGTNLADYGETGLSEDEWGSHGGRLSEIENFNQFEKLFVHLQGMVDFPGRLGTHGLSDTVNIRLVFDENSHCDWTRTRVGGAHPYFRVYSLAILKKLCAMETLERLHFKKGQFADVSFAFLLLAQPERESPADFIQGNVLNFRRTFIKPPLEYHIGPLQGYFFAPVVNIDFPWIYEHWEKWVEGKDPMREFKAEN